MTSLITDEQKKVLVSYFEKGLTSKKHKALLTDAQLETGLAVKDIEVSCNKVVCFIENR